MKLHAPNAALFVVAVILAIIAILQHLAIPLAIPAIAMLSIPRLALPDIAGVPGVDAFWLMLLAWVILAIATLLPKRAPRSQRPTPAVAT